MSSHASQHDTQPGRPGRTDSPVPVVLRNTPRGYDWVFYSREEPRMHIQTTPDADVVCKIWLEKEGAWSVEKSGDVPAKVFNAVKETFEAKPELAWRVRALWIRQMIAKDWLKVRLAGSEATVVGYPGTPHEFRRVVDLSKHAPPSFFATRDDVRLDSETAALALGVKRPEDEWVLVDLADTLWTP